MHIHYDRLYGRILYSDDDLRLFQTPEMTRQRHISLSAIPTWTLPTGMCASKFEHDVGCSHIARVIGQIPEFKPIAHNLRLAALVHDNRTPPFSHLSDRFMEEAYGFLHDEFEETVPKGSALAKELERQGGDLEVINALITGKYPPYSDLLNGSIDIDNLDNTLRYSLSLGLISKAPYSPIKLAESFRLHNEQICLLSQAVAEIEQWEEVRRITYNDFVYSSSNLRSGTMLARALELEVQDNPLPENYFSMTDMEAFNYLRTCANWRSCELMEQLLHWYFYERVYNWTAPDVASEVENLFNDFQERRITANNLAELIHAEPQDVCVYLGKSKGFKQIHTPLLDESGNLFPYSSEILQPVYMAQVYLLSVYDSAKNRQVIQEYMTHLLQLA